MTDDSQDTLAQKTSKNWEKNCQFAQDKLLTFHSPATYAENHPDWSPEKIQDEIKSGVRWDAIAICDEIEKQVNTYLPDLIAKWKIVNIQQVPHPQDFIVYKVMLNDGITVTFDCGLPSTTWTLPSNRFHPPKAREVLSRGLMKLFDVFDGFFLTAPDGGNPLEHLFMGEHDRHKYSQSCPGDNLLGCLVLYPTIKDPWGNYFESRLRLRVEVTKIEIGAEAKIIEMVPLDDLPGFRFTTQEPKLRLHTDDLELGRHILSDSFLKMGAPHCHGVEGIEVHPDYFTPPEHWYDMNDQETEWDRLPENVPFWSSDCDSTMEDEYPLTRERNDMTLEEIFNLVRQEAHEKYKIKRSLLSGKFQDLRELPGLAPEDLPLHIDAYLLDAGASSITVMVSSKRFDWSWDNEDDSSSVYGYDD